MPRQLAQNLSVNLAYYHTWYGNFLVTDNLAITPSDFDQYCVTAPTDSRLPSDVSGKPVCGLFDITPAKFGVATNNLVTYVSNFGGKQTEVFNGIDVAVNARVRRDFFVTGGFATGNTTFNMCDAYVDNPKTAFGIVSTAAGTLPPTPGNGTTFQYCNYDTGWLTQAKMTGTYTLPWQKISVGGVMQNLPGQGHVRDVRRCTHHGVHQSALGIDANVRFHAKVPLLAFAAGVHIWVALAAFVFGGAGSCNECCIYGSARLQHEALRLQQMAH